MELLESKNKLPTFEKFQVVKAVVCATDHNSCLTAATFATQLRNSGVSTDLIMGERKLKWVFQRANSLNAGMCTRNEI